MTFLPVVVRELGVASRSRLTPRLRFFAVLVAVGIAGGLMLASGRSGLPTRELPTAIFGFISSLLFVWCFLAGVVLTADCLSGEKRQGTLGLLFLTDLRGYDIVLGKAAAASAQSLSVVIAVLPVLALPIMMGSVTWGQFVQMAAALVVTMLWSLALGLAVSAGHRDGRRAVLTALGLMLTLLLVPFGLMLAAKASGAGRLDGTVGALTPLALMFGAYEGAWRTKLGHAAYLHGLWLVGGTAIAGLALASWRLPRAWREGDASSSRSSGRNERHAQGGRENEVPLRRVRFRSSPYEAIVEPSLPVPWPVRWLFALAGLVWFGCVLQIFGNAVFSGRTRNEAAVVTAVLLCAGLHLLVKIVTAVIVTQRASEDAANGALELLLTTPLQPDAIRRGHLQATSRLLWRTRVGLSALNGVTLVAIFIGQRVSGEDMLPFAIVFLAGIATLWLDFRLIAELGLICGVRRRGHARAAFETAARVLLPGWVGFFGTFLIGSAGLRGAGEAGLLFALSAAWCLAASWIQLQTCRQLGAAVFMELTGGGWFFGRRERRLAPPFPSRSRPPECAGPPPADQGQSPEG